MFPYFSNRFNCSFVFDSNKKETIESLKSKFLKAANIPNIPIRFPFKTWLKEKRISKALICRVQLTKQEIRDLALKLCFQFK